MRKQKILIFGNTGSLGNILETEFSKTGYIVYTAGRSELASDFLYDFTRPSDLPSFEEITSLDAIIFAQGKNPANSFFEISEEQILEMLQLNIIGPILILQELYKKLIPNGLILFFSSIASTKGSYDPSYASAKSSLNGLIQTISNYLPSTRVNGISLGLVENSKVHNQMTEDFVEKHMSRMFGNKLIQPKNVIKMVNHLLENDNINRTIINLDGGYKN